MSDRNKIDDVKLMYNGKEIASSTMNLPENLIQLVEVSDGLTIVSLENSVYIKLSNIEADKITLDNIISNQQEFSLYGIRYRLPRGDKLPTKKRLRKKWMKKYGKEFTVDRCVITGKK